mmetsp:Transcript_90024/g.226481  ORF Transcript_90024/g.226481 Transcript_90024/m.226481 type:complete len:250 (-) Transcript_90024:502-1251(-)
MGHVSDRMCLACGKVERRVRLEAAELGQVDAEATQVTGELPDIQLALEVDTADPPRGIHAALPPVHVRRTLWNCHREDGGSQIREEGVAIFRAAIRFGLTDPMPIPRKTCEAIPGVDISGQAAIRIIRTGIRFVDLVTLKAGTAVTLVVSDQGVAEGELSLHGRVVRHDEQVPLRAALLGPDVDFATDDLEDRRVACCVFYCNMKPEDFGPLRSLYPNAGDHDLTCTHHVPSLRGRGAHVQQVPGPSQV